MSRKLAISAPASSVIVRDDAKPAAPMVLTGLVKTSKGYAVAVATFEADGSLQSLEVGPSQANKVYVAMKHQRMLAPMAVKV